MSGIWGAYFQEGLLLFFLFIYFLGGGGSLAEFHSIFEKSVLFPYSMHGHEMMDDLSCRLSPRHCVRKDHPAGAGKHRK